jgi:hypothetical protein
MRGIKSTREIVKNLRKNSTENLGKIRSGRKSASYRLFTLLLSALRKGGIYKLQPVILKMLRFCKAILPMAGFHVDQAQPTADTQQSCS